MPIVDPLSSGFAKVVVVVVVSSPIYVVTREAINNL